MMKQIIRFGLCAAVLMASAAHSFASAQRETAIVKAIRRAQDCVANIHSEKKSDEGGSLFSVDRGQKVNGMGTGVIIDERGYIVTNHHVVDGVDSLRVTIKDGSAYTAQVVSFDRKHDLAIIKVTPTRPLPVMPLGTSSDLMLGETVIAVGNAYGYEHTMTVGIVSALSRDVEVTEKQSYRNLIQTDASINPGNSGGPLVNLDGEVIGINVAIRAGAQRIGFAIPIDDARIVIAQLLNSEKLNNTWHGVVSHDAKTATHRRLIVDNTIADSPAAKAGFLSEDVILKVGETTVSDAADFERALLGKSAGESFEVSVRRNERNEKLTVALSALNQKPAMPLVARGNNNIPTTSASVAVPPSPEVSNEKFWKLFGVKLAPLPENEKSQVGPRYRGGMRVTSVRPSSAAATNGIQQGDILVGLHIWETVNFDNVNFVTDHPQLRTFAPIKFYVLRGEETLWGHLPLSGGR